MTAQQINIKIAEKCGWKIAGNLFGVTLSCDPKGEPTTGIPDYYKHLDACAEFEKLLAAPERCDYAEELLRMIREPENIFFGDKKTKKFPLNCFGYFLLVTMTAPQRCEAFLRLHGLWENVK